MFGLTRAPLIDRAGLTWFNVTTPLSLNALRGRLVILDFWTFCCINCMHVLPTLRRIEETFPEEVVVIGVHSPKFLAERDPANVIHAIARYGIRHPVIHDPEMELWRQYAVRAWPTLVFISPDGYVLGELAGEPDPERLIAGVGEMLRTWKEEGTLKPALFPLAQPMINGGRVSFPGKIKPLPCSDGTKRWAVADAGHHQIAVFDDTGREVARYGSGRSGFIDAGPATSAFNAPQGLACAQDAIYVADTGNHAIRRIDRASGTVVTLAGNGQRGRGLPQEPGAGAEVALASVWDLAIKDNSLFFANAGTHQLGHFDLRDSTVRALAGSGAESVVDGPAIEAHLAQPSGLALDATGDTLYFADSETSAIRALTLNGVPTVETLIGTGLFDFGHVNGPFAEARLQHPLGLTWVAGAVIVADSYNGRLRHLDLIRREVRDVGENAFACSDSVCRPASEPAGVIADGPDRLLMTDTNNHRIVEIRLDRQERRTWVE
jgi:thiol-disulfide isomerase/thioredoxin